MTPERWETVKQLFDSALEREPGQRRSYLAERCANDAELREELEQLLAHHERSTGLTSRPAFADALAAADRRLQRLAGQRLAHYEIEQLVGKGGMGAVYTARDARLGRRVAIKLLPPDLALDPERVQRFRREAQAGSLINHPNIVTVHEIGQLDDLYFIVTELVDGDTLEDRLAQGPLDCDEIVAIAAQLADALVEAHGLGIVHRDIKPSNLMLTRRGQLKVLDLGLAKMVGDSPDALGPIAWRSHQTLAGRLLGTAAYMSPEQSRGEDVDPRSDLFSVGVVMYQMTTGRRPFGGEALDEVLDEVRHREPAPIARHRAAVPAELARIIARCLVKQPAARYPSAAALLRDVQALARTRQQRRDAGAIKIRRRLAALAGALCVGLIALILPARAPVHTVPHTAEHAAPVLAAAARPPRFTQLSHDAGEELFPSLAPDGSWLVYASRASGNWDIYRRATAGGEAINLTAGSAHDEVQPAISPDGTRVAFRSERDGGGLFVMAADGTAVRRISALGANPAWSADGKEIVYATLETTFPHDRRPGEVRAMNLTSGEHRLVAAADATQPSCSPHGYRIAYWGLRLGSGQRDIWTIAAAHQPGEPAPVPVPVTKDEFLDWNPVWAPSGDQLYFISNRGGSMNLWSVAIDERTGAVQGPPVPITIPSAYVAHVSFAADGEHMAYAQIQTSANLQRVGFDPAREQVLGDPSFVTQGSLQISAHDVSPDGARLVVTASDAGSQEALYLYSASGMVERRLTDGTHHDRAPRWSPDGQRIAFYSDRSGKYEIWTVRPDGDQLTQVTYTSGGDVYYPIWSPGGARLLYQHRGEGNFLLDTRRSWSAQARERLSQDGIEIFTPWGWSPDGQRLVGGVRRQGHAERSLASYEIASGQYEDLTTRGLGPAVWLRDSRRVIFRNGSTLYLLDRATRAMRDLLSIAPDTIDTISVAADNRTIYFVRAAHEADIWLARVDPRS